MAAESIKWFDLNRFGASLRIIPKSPLRGVAVSCLQVHDKDLFQRMFGWMPERGMSADDRRILNENFTQAKNDLGFNEQQHFIDDEDRQCWRFFSTKTRFTLSELSRLCPGLTTEDIREMPMDDIRLVVKPDTEITAEWASFTNEVLARDNKGVWTPIANPFDKPFDQSGDLRQVASEYLGQPFQLLARNNICLYAAISDKLHQANYKQNALVPFYADLESAQSDGWKREELQQTDLPYAAPLWVTQAGQIIAIKDVRFVPEIMDSPPEYYYGTNPNGLIVSAIREAKTIVPRMSKITENWREWGTTPDNLEMPDLLWGSITEAVSAAEELRQRYPRLTKDVDYLTDGKEAERGGAVRAKPLTEITQSDAHRIVSAVSRYVPMTNDKLNEMAALLGVAIQRGHELMADHAKIVANQKLIEMTHALQVAESGESAKHVDVGEKIGGARKDYAKRAMTEDDLLSMNNLERQTYVLKKNIWMPLDYAKMRDDGIDPRAAIAIKYFKNSIKIAPYYRPGEEPYGLEAEYIKAVSKVRDAMADVKTLDDFKETCSRLFHEGRENTNYIIGGTRFQIAIGKRASELLAASSSCYPDWQKNVAFLPFAIAKEIKKQEIRVAGYDNEPTDEQLWGCLIKTRTPKSDAQKVVDKEKVEQDRYLHCPHLEKVERNGKDWRAGRDIVADDLLKHFGFRAVEFGNWLPQDERQQVLNMAFDSLCDLADSLDIPPSGISFGGELAVAFGSRGHGGKQAALAHFEPARFVINLTRMNGAGSLAHEWMHAFDYYLGNKENYASKSRQNDTMFKLVNAMKTQKGDAEKIHAQAVHNARRGAENALSWLYQQHPETQQRVKETINSFYDKTMKTMIKQTINYIENNKNKPSFAKDGIASHGVISSETRFYAKKEIMESLKQFSDKKSAFTKVKEKVEGNILYMIDNLAVACTIDAARLMSVDLPESFLLGENRAESNFYVQAKKLDKTRSKAYWSATHELFARAGAAYVSDRLDANGVRSDYLVYGSKEDQYMNYPAGNPNPVGNERQVLAEHMEKLMAEYRLACLSRFETGAEIAP